MGSLSLLLAAGHTGFVHGFARMDLVLDAIKTGHQQGSKAQVRVSRRVRETYFDTTCFRRRNHRNTDRRRTVTRRVSQHYRCFVARDQTLVRVGGRVCRGVNRFSVFDYAANVVQRLFRQTCVFVASKQVDAVLDSDMWQCIPEPLSPNIGFGIKVAVLPKRCATLCTTYL